MCAWTLPVKQEKKLLVKILGTDIFPISSGLDSLSPRDNSFPGSDSWYVCALQVSHRPE